MKKSFLLTSLCLIILPSAGYQARLPPLIEEISLSRGTVGQLQSRQNSLVRIMACVTNDTIRLTRNFNRLRGALIELQSVEVKMEQILEVEAAVLQISSMADKLFRGLEELMAGRLSFDLLLWVGLIGHPVLLSCGFFLRSSFERSPWGVDRLCRFWPLPLPLGQVPQRWTFPWSGALWDFCNLGPASRDSGWCGSTAWGVPGFLRWWWNDSA